jgi:hypothetical protein
VLPHPYPLLADGYYLLWWEGTVQSHAVTDLRCPSYHLLHGRLLLLLLLWLFLPLLPPMLLQDYL